MALVSLSCHSTSTTSNDTAAISIPMALPTMLQSKVLLPSSSKLVSLQQRRIQLLLSNWKFYTRPKLSMALRRSPLLLSPPWYLMSRRSFTLSLPWCYTARQSLIRLLSQSLLSQRLCKQSTRLNPQHSPQCLVP